MPFGASVTTGTTLSASGTITPLTPLSPTEYYGYTMLAAEENGAVLLKIYDRLVTTVENMETEFVLPEEERVNMTDFKKVWNYYRLDYPQHFWRDSVWDYRTDNGYVVDGTIRYAMTREERDSRRAAMEDAVDSFLAGISGDRNEYERERAIYETLCRYAFYDTEATSEVIYDLTGPLVDGIGSCEGYAEAFQYLLYRAGIQCLSVEGNADGIPHKWNVVRIDGEYYHVDVTWGDAWGKDDILLYGYLNLPYAEISRDHVMYTNEGYPIPLCRAIEASYAMHSSGYMETLDQDQLVELLKNGNGKTEIYLAANTMDEFADWFFDTYEVTFYLAGYAGYGFTIYPVGFGAVIELYSW